MEYASVKDTAIKFNISERRVQKLCEEGRIIGATMISGVWLIPDDAKKPLDERCVMLQDDSKYITLQGLCDELSISIATGRNWIKLKKLVPSYVEKRTPIFERVYVEKLKKALLSGENISLKSRRNKKFIEGNNLYNSYVSDKCKGITSVKRIFSEIEKRDIVFESNELSYFIANYALKLFAIKYKLEDIERTNIFMEFLEGNVSFDDRDRLIWDLIDDKKKVKSFAKKYKAILDKTFSYEEGEDLLGLLYISLKDMGSRKSAGAYYTPNSIVKKLVSHILIRPNGRLLDPCCGTGNFLIQLPNKIDFENIYGNDIDPISVKITRINMALKYPDAKTNKICDHISISDYLCDFEGNEFSYIIGNPPWGYDFKAEDRKKLSNIYEAASVRNAESFDVFIEKSLKLLKKNGRLAFVLPESILNVKSHEKIRKIIARQSSITYLEYLGNSFDGVNCPSAIMQLKNDGKIMSTVGLKVSDGKKSFTVATKRDVDTKCFNFFMSDEEYNIIKKLQDNPKVITLKGNGDFALGIVTGNNKEILSDVKKKGYELILKGADIEKYRIVEPKRYVAFKPENFQQVAPVEMYRAKEKLLYRFISDKLIFAYDNRGMVSLNSCNIVIPKIKGLDMKYILAVLNSKTAQFVFKNMFNSVKVLRAHIESIPIPVASTAVQKKIIALVEKTMIEKQLDKREKNMTEIDKLIYKAFGFNKNEVLIIEKSIGIKGESL